MVQLCAFFASLELVSSVVVATTTLEVTNEQRHYIAREFRTQSVTSVDAREAETSKTMQRNGY